MSSNAVNTDIPFCDPIIKKELEKIRDRVLKKDRDWLAVYDGEEGCLTGDSMIQISRNKLSKRYSLKWLYNQFNGNPEGVIHKNKNWDLSHESYVRSFNGKDVRLHKVKAVHYSGKKAVYELKLENGKSIKATISHKFLTRNGWEPLCDLNGKEVMCDTLKPKQTNRRRIKLRDIYLKVYHHPFSNITNHVEVHRLIYEARINNLHFLDYLDILLNEPEKAKKMEYIDSKIYHIHHKDGCHYNNSIENLELMNKTDHFKYHGLNGGYANFSQGVPIFSKVKSIIYLGVEDTYDIECEEPYHNFVANEIIVHNSGKSVLAMQHGKILDPNLSLKNIVFSSDEFIKLIRDPKTKKGTCIILDEAFNAANSRACLTEVNRSMIALATEMRQKNLIVLVVLPSFFDLDKYFALWRSRVLVHVYFTPAEERRYVVFDRYSKKMLYLTGKKTYNYSKPKAPFPPSRFYNQYTVNEKEYRAKKAAAFKGRTVSNQARNWMIQRNGLIKHLIRDMGYTHEQVNDTLKGFNAKGISKAQMSFISKGLIKEADVEEAIEIKQRTS